MNKGRTLIVTAAVSALGMAAGFTATAHAQPAYTGPLGQASYASDAPGAVAITSGDYAAAEAQLKGADASNAVGLINLGSVYVKTGRYRDAERAFRAAAAAPSKDVRLADGTEITTTAAARVALRRLYSSMAMAAN